MSTRQSGVGKRRSASGQASDAGSSSHGKRARLGVEEPVCQGPVPAALVEPASLMDLFMELKKRVFALEEQSTTARTDREALQRAVEDKERERFQVSRELVTRDEELARAREELARVGEELAQAKRDLGDSRAALRQSEETIATQNTEIIEKGAHIRALRQALGEKNRHNETLFLRIREVEKTLEDAKENNDRLSAIVASRNSSNDEQWRQWQRKLAEDAANLLKHFKTQIEVLYSDPITESLFEEPVVVTYWQGDTLKCKLFNKKSIMEWKDECERNGRPFTDPFTR